MIEVWKQLKENDKYEISNFGAVRKICNKHVMYVEDNSAGYLRVCLNKKKYFIHRLVATYFCDGWFEGAVVNHKDFNKHNNVYTNLEWLSRSANAKHASEGGHQPGEFVPIIRNILYGGKIYHNITMADFIGLVGICKSTFYNWLESGKISYVSNDYPEKE